MKILFCSSTFGNITNGPAKFAQLLLQINTLFPDIELRILTESIDKATEGQVYKIELDYPRPVHGLGKFLRMWSYYKAASNLRAEYPFEVIVFNDAMIGLLSSWLMPKQVKAVGLLNDADSLNANLLNFRWSRKWLIKWIHKPFEALAVRNLRKVIACSDFLREKANAVYRPQLSRVATLYQAAEIGDVEVRKKSLETNQRICILFVKANYKIGGLKYLIKALALLGPRQFELVVIGPPEEWRPQVERLFLPAENIEYTFLGPQSQAEVFRRMQTSDILCIPSLQEGLGVANIEGLIYGIPVVSTNVGGIPEVLGNGAFGWLAKPGNPVSLAEAIRACIENSDLRFEKSLAGRQFAKENFEYKKMLKRFVQILSEA